jgi:hypothetical protein
MSYNAPNDSSRLQARWQTFNLGSLAPWGVTVSWFMRMPSWALIPCGLFALACVTLRETFPQESADRLKWWGYVLPSKGQPLQHEATLGEKPAGVERSAGRLKLLDWSRRRSKS